MKKLIINLFLIVAFLGFNGYVMDQASAAVNLQGTLNRTGSGIYDNNQAAQPSFPVLIGNVIKMLLGVLGVLLLGIIVYAGYLWTTAGGDEGQVKKAIAWIRNALIGMVITLSAYALTDYVMAKLIAATYTE